jgi:hypothetical protein
MKDIKELAKEAEKSFKCPYLEICREEKYNSCYNHSHVLCDDFLDLYNNYQMREQKDLNS